VRLNAPLIAAVLATLLCLGVYWGHRTGAFRVPLLDRLDLDAIDAMFQIRGARAPADDRIVIVGLDERTRREAPRLFQLREEQAKLIDAIAALQPAAIGIDVLYSSPEINLPGAVVEEVRRAADALVAKLELKTPQEAAAEAALRSVIDAVSGDEKLAAAVARAGNVRLGVLFFVETEVEAAGAFEEPAGLGGARYGETAVVEQPFERRPPRAQRYALVPLAPIAEAAAGLGALNVVVDNDGDVRRVYGVVEQGGRYYMPFGLAMAAAVLGDSAQLSYVTSETSIGFGGDAFDDLEVDERGIAQLDFLGPAGTFEHVSAVDVLEGRVAPEVLADKLVFVGRTDTAQDRYATPFDRVMPGVEIHATLAHNALHGELLRRASPYATLLAILLLGVALSSLQLRIVRGQRSWYVGVGGLLVVLAWLIIMQLLFAVSGIILELAAPFVSIVIITLAALTTSLATEGREKAQLRAAFSQYVQKTVVDRILDHPERVRLGGVRRELTVLFSDIRGFSKFAEKLDPQVLSELLNDYLTPMTELVMRNGGMLDKYIGDAVMAVYGAPLDLPDHPACACRTALAMQREMTALNEQFRARGLPEFAIGVGVNSGPMSVGNMGSQARFDYTVLGDAVNLAARLEGLTKEYRAAVIVGDSTRNAAGDEFVFRELDLVRVTGRAGTARIFELVETAERSTMSADYLAAFARGLAAYRNADWDDAEHELKALVAKRPVDGPAHVLLARIQELRHHPPPPDWDGVYEQRSK